MIPGNYAALNDKFYCKTHYESNYKKRGSYVFEDGDNPQTPDPSADAQPNLGTTAEMSTTSNGATVKEVAALTSPPTTPTEPVAKSSSAPSEKAVERSSSTTPTEPVAINDDSTQGMVPSPTVEKVSSPVIQVTVDDDYDTVMKEQEKRTRASVSSKAREAAEKMGLDVPPDPLEDLGGEEKTEKVMERRLSVVAQRSEKSKERAEAAAKWLDKQIRKVKTWIGKFR